MLSMQVGLCVGAQRIDDILRQLGQGHADQHRVFAEFMAAIPAGIPVGTARLYWAPGPLMEHDAVLADIEGRYRKGLLQECILIIGLYKA